MLPDEAMQLLFLAGISTRCIAERTQLSQRRVQAIVQPVRPASLPAPDDDTLDAMVLEQHDRLGQEITGIYLGIKSPWFGSYLSLGLIHNNANVAPTFSSLLLRFHRPFSPLLLRFHRPENV